MALPQAPDDRPQKPGEVLFEFLFEDAVVRNKPRFFDVIAPVQDLDAALFFLGSESRAVRIRSRISSALRKAFVNAAKGELRSNIRLLMRWRTSTTTSAVRYADLGVAQRIFSAMYSGVNALFRMLMPRYGFHFLPSISGAEVLKNRSIRIGGAPFVVRSSRFLCRPPSAPFMIMGGVFRSGGRDCGFALRTLTSSRV